MAWSTPKSWTTGYKVLASDMNTFLSDNDSALRSGGIAITSQAAGDVLYASSSTQLARLAIGTANKILTSSGSAPQWSTQIVNAALPTNVDLGGTLDVTGATTLDSTLDVVGNVVFNDAGADKDFRVETSANANALNLTSTGLGLFRAADLNYYQTIIAGSFTSGGDSSVASGLVTETAITGHVGDVARLTGQSFTSSLATPAASMTLVLAAQTYIAAPTITVGSGSAVTNAASLYILDAPGEATNNYALWVDEGVSRFDGNVGIGTATPNYLSAPTALTLQGATQPRLEIVGTRTGDDATGQVMFINRVSTTNNIMAYIAGNRSGADSSGSLTFVTYNSASAVTAMTIAPAGDVGIGVTPTGGDLCIDAAESATPTIRLENDQGTVDGSIDSWTSTTNIQLWIGANEYLNSGSPARFNSSYDTAAVELQAGYVILRTGDDATSTARLTVEPGGAVAVAGALSKGSGSFKIDHPLPSMTDTHHLIHSFAESNETLLIYRGAATLVAGQATVDLDDAAGMTAGTWALLCREAQCYTTNETGWHHVRGSVTGSTLTIDCEEECDDVVSWMVVTNRQDTHIMETEWTDEDGHPIVEPEK